MAMPWRGSSELARHTDRDVLRLHRMALGLPGESQRFAEGWLSRLDDGGWLLEAHPVDEFPGADPAQVLPSALSARAEGPGARAAQSAGRPEGRGAAAGAPRRIATTTTTSAN